MKKKVILLIPKAYNDGNPIPPEVLYSVFERIYIAYNGWTDALEVVGAYRMQSGVKQVERMIQVWVVLDESEIPELRRMTADFCTELKQEAIYFEITGSVVEFVGPQKTQGSAP